MELLQFQLEGALRFSFSSKWKTFFFLLDAYQQVELVAQHINQHIKQQDNFMKMLAIQKSLAGPAAPKILVPGRIFVKEGVLKKVGCVLYCFSLANFTFLEICRSKSPFIPSICTSFEASSITSYSGGSKIMKWGSNEPPAFKNGGP